VAVADGVGNRLYGGRCRYHTPLVFDQIQLH
jgi:hypothetical protein